MRRCNCSCEDLTITRYKYDKVKAILGQGASLPSALALYRLAAGDLKGVEPYLPAVVRVSEMHRLGLGTPANSRKAAQWFERGLKYIQAEAERGNQEMIRLLIAHYRKVGKSDLAAYWESHLA